MKLNKLYAFSLVMVALASFGVGYAVQTGLFEHGHAKAVANLYIFTEQARADGTVYHGVYLVGNTLTAIGEQYAEYWLGGSGSMNTTALNATQWISWGNSTITTAKTILDTEATTAGFGRALATVSAEWSNGGHYARNFTITITASATINLNACGLHWSGVASAASTLYALAALPQATTFNTSDNCSALWEITYTWF